MTVCTIDMRAVESPDGLIMHRIESDGIAPISACRP